MSEARYTVHVRSSLAAVHVRSSGPPAPPPVTPPPAADDPGDALLAELGDGADFIDLSLMLIGLLDHGPA